MNPIDSYEAFAREITLPGVITDPWIDGQPRFSREPVCIRDTTKRELYEAAEQIASVYNELSQIVSDAPELIDDFFCLTPFQKAMWVASHGRWHAIARADIFKTSTGLAIAELNSDTPTGEAEAITLANIAHRAGNGTNPNLHLEHRWASVIELLANADIDGWQAKASRTAGIVYPTEFTEDLPTIRLYKEWLERAGYEVILGSPYNLEFDGERTRLFQFPIDVIVRHYKTDWWSERAPVWRSDAIADARPLDGPLGAVFAGMAAGTLTVMNPFGSVLTQNKRAMAFMWEHIHRFSHASQRSIERLLPVTSRLERMHEEELIARRSHWVLKSDYGAEGEEVIVGKHTTDGHWRAAIQDAAPGRWIAQQYFEPEQREDGNAINYGVFVIAGEACGIYTRVEAGPTDVYALSAPTLVVGDEAPSPCAGASALPVHRP